MVSLKCFIFENSHLNLSTIQSFHLKTLFFRASVVVTLRDFELSFNFYSILHFFFVMELSNSSSIDDWRLTLAWVTILFPVFFHLRKKKKKIAYFVNKPSFWCRKQMFFSVLSYYYVYICIFFVPFSLSRLKMFLYLFKILCVLLLLLHLHVITYKIQVVFGSS